MKTLILILIILPTILLSQVELLGDKSKVWVLHNNRAVALVENNQEEQNFTAFSLFKVKHDKGVFTFKAKRKRYYIYINESSVKLFRGKRKKKLVQVQLFRRLGKRVNH